MLRYKAFLKIEALYVLLLSSFLFLFSMFMLYFLQLNSADNGAFFIRFFMLGIVPMTGYLVVVSLYSRTVLMLPVSPLAKYLYSWMRQFAFLVIYLLFMVLFKFFMTHISGDEVHTPIETLAVKDYLWLMLVESVVIFWAALFRNYFLKIVGFVAVIGFSLVFDTEINAAIKNGMMYGAILLLVVLLNFGSYQIFKCWQPANCGYLMI